MPDAPVAQDLWQDILNAAANKACIVKLISYGIPFSILDRSRDGFNAKNLLDPLCHEQRNSADTAVEVYYRIGHIKLQSIDSGIIQYNGLFGIDLQKALRTDGEAQRIQVFYYGITAKYYPVFPAHNEVCVIGIYVVDDGLDIWNSRKQSFDKLIPVRKLAGGDNYHHRATLRTANHAVTKYSLLFCVRRGYCRCISRSPAAIAH